LGVENGDRIFGGTAGAVRRAGLGEKSTGLAPSTGEFDGAADELDESRREAGMIMGLGKEEDSDMRAGEAGVETITGLLASPGREPGGCGPGSGSEAMAEGSEGGDGGLFGCLDLEIRETCDIC